MSWNRGMASSAKDDWATPDWLFKALSVEYGPFDLDAAAAPATALCRQFYTQADDALARLPWTGKVWLNPPYGRAIGAFVRGARVSAEAGATVVCLLPARTDTRWWHEEVLHAAEVHLLAGRVRFLAEAPYCGRQCPGFPACGVGVVRRNGHLLRVGDPAPFPSAVVVFRPRSYLGRFMQTLHQEVVHG